MDYKNIPAMNQSLLKTILKSPIAFKKMQESMYEESDNDSFRFGTLVDIMTTEPDTDILSLFAIQPDILIPDTIRPILDKCADQNQFDDNALIEYADEFNYCASMKNDTRLNRIKVDNWKEYIDFKIASKEKTVITRTEYNQAIVCKMSLFSNEFTKKYFVAEKDIEIINKLVILNKVNGVDFKYELDKVIINHRTKTIYPVDIKTIGTSVYYFESNFWKFRYDFQGAMYYNACKHHYSSLLEQGYTLDNFRFIVCEKDSIHSPIIYRMSDNTINLAIHGGTRSNHYTSGIIDAIDRYNWHISNNKWEYPMEYYSQEFIEI